MKHRDDTITRWNELAERARDLIRDEAMAGGSSHVAEIARTLGVSPRLLQEAFAHSGRRYSDVVREVRLGRAAELLVRGRAVGVSASMVGYASVSAFRAGFKREFGVSPVVFRYAAMLYQHLEWRTEQKGLGHSRMLESIYSGYEANRDRRGLTMLLKGLNSDGRKLLQAHARSLHPQWRRSAPPGVVGRSYARER